MDIAVVGGSLGGLTAACLLTDAGHDVTIYERSPRELEERGAGIGLLPHTSRYLVERAGLRLEDVAIATDHIRYLNRDGTIVHDAEHRYLFSSWTTVYRELLACFDKSRYRLGHELTTLTGDDAGVTLGFASGKHLRCDVAVCADGVASTARSILLPAVRAEYSGYVAWRGMVRERDLPAGTLGVLDNAITYQVTANSHVLVYPIPGRDGSVQRGDRLINVVWYRNYLASGDLDDLLTDRNGERHDVSMPPGSLRDEHVAEARAVAAARLAAPIADVIERIEQLFVQVVVDLDVEQMAFGRACLIGDAAFVARPHAAAGTAKAAEDAWTLSEALAKHPDDPVGALAAWEPAQLDLGRQLLARTRAIGRRSQVDGNWIPGDPETIFGLYGPGR